MPRRALSGDGHLREGEGFRAGGTFVLQLTCTTAGLNGLSGEAEARSSRVRARGVVTRLPRRTIRIAAFIQRST
jgi:hypothetical protein